MRKVFATNLKRIISLMLSILICCSTFLGNVSCAAKEYWYGESYIKDDEYVRNILPETTVSDFKNNIDDQEVEIYDGDKILEDDELIGTGMTIKKGEEEHKLAVLGDLTGNGKIGITDFVKMNLHSVGLVEKFKNEYAKAADMNKDGQVTVTDLTRMKLAIVKIIDVIAPRTFVPEVEITKKEVIVRGKSTDANSGIKGYWFEIDNEGWVSNDDQSKNEYRFTDLINNTEYTVRMKVEDNEGNVKVSKRIQIRTLPAETASINITTSSTEWTNKNVTVSVFYNSNMAEKTMEISIDDGATWKEYTEPVEVSKNTAVKARVKNEENEVIEEARKEIKNIDKLAPKEFEITLTSTTNSIKVNAVTTDREATSEYGKSEIKEYIYQISNNRDWAKEIRTTDTTHTFENLEQNQEYMVKVIAVDNAGNETENKKNGSSEKTIKTETIDDIGEITIVATPTEWTNGDVTVTATYPATDKIKEISIDNGATWKAYIGAETVSKNTTVLARIKDNIGQVGAEKSLSITNIDKLPPKEFTIKTIATPNSITVIANTEDEDGTNEYGKSGMQGYSFQINDEPWTAIQSLGEYKFSNLVQGDTYTIKVKAIDNVGNERNDSDSDEIGETGKPIVVPTVDDEIEGEIQIIPSTTNWTNNKVLVEIIYPDAKGYMKEVSIDDGTTWTEYEQMIEIEENTTVKARLRDATNQIGKENNLDITNIDKLAPEEFDITDLTATENSITVKASTVDRAQTTTNGCSGIKEYEYILINGLWKWKVISTDEEYTFTNLMQGKEYEVKVIAVDNAGNKTESNDNGTTKITTSLNGKITITGNPKPETWTKDKVTVTVTFPNYTEGLERLISTNGGSSWTPYTDQTVNIDIYTNTQIQAKMVDGTEQVGNIETYDVTNIDKDPPNVFNVTTSNVTNTTITVSGSTTDAKSGVAEYWFSINNGDTWETNTNKLTTSYTYNSLTPNTQYNIKMKAVDKVGNEYITDVRQETTKAEYTVIYNNGTATSGTLPNNQTAVYNESITLASNNMIKSNTNLGTVTFNLNGGKIGTSTTNPTSTAQTKYTANGWTTTSGSTTRNYTNGQIFTYNLTSNLNLYPCFSETPISATFPSVNPTKDGCIFDGWYTDQTGGTKITDYSYIGTSNVTYHAHWKGNGYTVIYNKGTATNGILPSNQTATYNESITLASNNMIKSNTNLGTVTFNLNGGKIGTSTINPTSTAQTKYTANGWTTTSGSTTRNYTNGQTFIYNLTSNLNLYPCFSETKVSATFPSVNPTKDGYTFDGWYTDQTGGTEVTSYTGTIDVTYHAHWKEKDVEIYAKLYNNGTLVFTASDRELYGLGGVDNDYGKLNNSYSFWISIPWHSDISKITKINFADQIFPISLRYWFYDCENLISINNINNLKTSNVKDMTGMFSGCESLTSVDVSNFDTSNVTDTSAMFQRCHSLESLDLSNFNTSKVKNMGYMFNGCKLATSIDVSNFDTSNVTNMVSMFDNCIEVVSLDVSNFDTSKVTNMDSMFWGCDNLEELNLSNFDTSNVTNMYGMFYSCDKLKTLNVSNFNTSKVTNMARMFGPCKELTSLNVSNFNTSNVTNMSEMFFWCSSLTELNLNNFDTSKVTNMDWMFCNCYSLERLYINNFNTSNVTDMNRMFEDCKSLISLNVSNFNTSKVTNMKWMFEECESLTVLNLSNFNTSNVTNMEFMFDRCKNLISIDVSNFNTSNVETMQQMFNGCSKLKTLNLKSFTVTPSMNLSYMFSDCNDLEYVYALSSKWSSSMIKGSTNSGSNNYKMFDGSNISKVTLQ